VISHHAWKSVAVISEDLGNPVSDAVKRWCENEGIPVTQQCLDLPETIERLASAHAVAAGRGTFVPALVYLFTRERELYLFEPSDEPLLCDPSITLYEVRDAEGHYVKKILNNNWHNNRAQRTMDARVRHFLLERSHGKGEGSMTGAKTSALYLCFRRFRKGVAPDRPHSRPVPLRDHRLSGHAARVDAGEVRVGERGLPPSIKQTPKKCSFRNLCPNKRPHSMWMQTCAP